MRENMHSPVFNWVIQSSSVVERSAVNRLVVGSNPTSGANDAVSYRTRSSFNLISYSVPT